MAQDIVSESFLRLWIAWDRVEAVTLRAYLFAIARNLYLNRRQAAKRESELPDELPSAEEPVRRAEARDELPTRSPRFSNSQRSSAPP